MKSNCVALADERLDARLRSLVSMNKLLLFSGAVRKDPAIDAWLGSQPDDLRPIAREWFEQMRQCGDDVRELMHDGCPVVCGKDAPFAYVNVFAFHVTGLSMRHTGT